VRRDQAILARSCGIRRLAERSANDSHTGHIGLLAHRRRPRTPTLRGTFPLCMRASPGYSVNIPCSVGCSLAPAQEALLVGGRASAGGDHPVMFVVDASAAARRGPLHPNSPYAKVADLASLAARGDEVVAIGAAHGGAHANFRWTVWAGSTQRLDDYPQTFETFGGQSAGGLSNIVFTSDGPVIAGTWAAKEGGGLDTAVWLPRGRQWIRQESVGTALTPRRFRSHLARQAPPARP
jgi:hypothetical protein